MIIDCTACNARFRLDETKIKGRGARVRCRRCGESILVLKPEMPQEEISAPVPPEAPRESAKDEIDLAFDKILFTAKPEKDPAAQDAPIESVQPETPSVAPQVEISSRPPEASITFMPEEKVHLQDDAPVAPPPEFDDLPEPEPVKEPAGKPAAFEAAPDRLNIELQIEKRDTLDELLREFESELDEKKTEKTQTQEELDISGRLMTKPPSPEEPDLDRPQDIESQLRDLGMKERELSRPLSAPSIESTLPTSPAVTESEPLSSTPETAEITLSDSPPPQPEVPPEPIKPSIREFPQPARPPVRTSRMLLALLFLAVSGGGGYLGFTKDGQDILRSIHPGIGPLLEQGGAKKGPQFDIRNVVGYFEPGTVAGELFIIKGQVVNAGSMRKSGIKVKARILDDKEKVLGEASSYAGNIINMEPLKTETQAKIEETLSNRFGNQLANLDIPPGKSIPFMVVFFNVPGNVGAYTLEAKEGE